MLKKQRLTAMEGKHHDAKPCYTRKPKCERCRDTGWINTSPQEASLQEADAIRAAITDLGGVPEPLELSRA